MKYNMARLNGTVSTMASGTAASLAAGWFATSARSPPLALMLLRSVVNLEFTGLAQNSRVDPVY